MKDRLKDLKGNATEASDLADVELGVDGDVSEKGEDEASAEQNGFMADFFRDVGAIKSTLALIKKNVRTIEERHHEAMTAITAEQKQEISDELDQLMDETNQAAQQVRTKLKQMDQENQQLQKKNGLSSEMRIRTNMHGTLTRKFVEQMQEFQEIQTKYKNKIKETLERQIKIVKPDASREEVEEALQNPNPQIFANGILTKGHAAAKNALADIQERHRDITKLEQSIAELHQLFLDMAVLVESQGELLDQIEYSVAQSVNYTGKAAEELYKARKYQMSARKKMCCIIGILLIVVVIILVPILVKVLKSA